MSQHTPNSTEFMSMMDKFQAAVRELETAKNTEGVTTTRLNQLKLKIRHRRNQIIEAYRLTRREFFYSLRHDGHYKDCDYCI
jgi:hypothetical protein